MKARVGKREEEKPSWFEWEKLEIERIGVRVEGKGLTEIGARVRGGKRKGAEVNLQKLEGSKSKKLE